LLWGGKPAKIIKAAENHRVGILISEEIIAEISRVLTYPKLEKVYQSEGLHLSDLIEKMLKIGKFVKVLDKVNVVNDHPADNKFLECASAAEADYVVSGDKHLLKVVCYEKTQILSVNEFLQVMEAKRQPKKD
jgi:putative PIN family toxin of toxin-antitoxin system